MIVLILLSEQLLKDNDYNGFPVIVDHQTQMLVGFVSRRDIKVALRKLSINSQSVNKVAEWDLILTSEKKSGRLVI